MSKFLTKKNITYIIFSLIIFSFFLGFYYDENSAGAGGYKGDITWILNNIEIFKRMSPPVPLNLFKPVVNLAFKSSGIDPFYTRFASSFVLKIDKNTEIDGTGVMEIMDLQ